MESRIIQLTQAGRKHGNLNLSACGKDFFPPDAFGSSSRANGLGVPITLSVTGFGRTHKYLSRRLISVMV